METLSLTVEVLPNFPKVAAPFSIPSSNYEVSTFSTSLLNYRKEVIFKLNFEEQIKMCQLEEAVRARFPCRRSSMNKGKKM